MGTNGKTVDIAGHPVPRLCGGPRNMIAGGASPYIAWGKSGHTMGDPPLSGRTPNLSRIIPADGETTGMSGGGMSDMGGEPDRA